MKSRKKIRMKTLNIIIALTFVLSMVFAFIDTEISNILLIISFFTMVINLILNLFWVKIKSIKKKETLKLINKKDE